MALNLPSSVDLWIPHDRPDSQIFPSITVQVYQHLPAVGVWENGRDSGPKVQHLSNRVIYFQKSHVHPWRPWFMIPNSIVEVCEVSVFRIFVKKKKLKKGLCRRWCIHRLTLLWWLFYIVQILWATGLTTTNRWYNTVFRLPQSWAKLKIEKQMHASEEKVSCDGKQWLPEPPWEWDDWKGQRALGWWWEGSTCDSLHTALCTQNKLVFEASDNLSKQARVFIKVPIHFWLFLSV